MDKKLEDKGKNLDEKEKEFFKKGLADLQAAQLHLQQAQENFNNKNAAVVGAFALVKFKYDLPDGAKITADGEIVIV